MIKTNDKCSRRTTYKIDEAITGKMKLGTLSSKPWLILLYHYVIIPIYAKHNCTCEFKPEAAFVGPYCAEWVANERPFCYLYGIEGQFCPDAIKSELGDFYWTENEKVCKGSDSYIEYHCNCQ